LLSSPVWAQEVSEDSSTESTEESPAEPSEDADSGTQDPNLELFSDPVFDSVEEGEETWVEETPQVLEEVIPRPKKEAAEELVAALLEVRDVRIRRHKILGIAFMPGAVLLGVSSGSIDLVFLPVAIGAGVILVADRFGDVIELDQGIERLRNGTMRSMELGELYLWEAARSGKRRRSILGGSLLAGSLVFYAVSVQAEQGPLAYNLGGLMVIGSAVLTFRESRLERIEQAYEQRATQIESRNSR
jgi:hypothetical protein